MIRPVRRAGGERDPAPAADTAAAAEGGGGGGGGGGVAEGRGRFLFRAAVAEVERPAAHVDEADLAGRQRAAGVVENLELVTHPCGADRTRLAQPLLRRDAAEAG